MSDTAPEPQGRESILDTLKDTTIGGFPVWAVALAVVVIVWFFLRSKSSSSSSPQKQSTAAAANTQGVASTQGSSSNVGTAAVPVLVTGTPVIPTSNIDTQSQQMPLTTGDTASSSTAAGNNYTTSTGNISTSNQASADSLTSGDETGQPASGTATNITTA